MKITIKNDQVILNFWKVLEAFTPQQQALFLKFTWGRSRLPLAYEDFSHDFKIQKTSYGNSDEQLPQSHTCFFTLDLPPYSSIEIMREKLLYAITECQAIDTDYNAGNAELWDV